MPLYGGKEDLITTLARMSHCEYISDLHNRFHASDVRKSIEAVDCGDYPLREWNDVARYLSKQKVSFESPSEAKAYLLGLLSR